MHSIALIANGKTSNYSSVKQKLRGYDIVFAVDGGLNHCVKMEVIPDQIIGDFDSTDSLDRPEFSQVPRKHYDAEKNHTDLELAIEEALKHSPIKITIFGATEGRTDHALANLYLLMRYPDLLSIESDYETILAIQGKRTLPCMPGQTLSLLPLGEPCHGVSTKGCKWELAHNTLDFQFMSISNVCLENEVTIEVLEGTLVCYLVNNKP